MTVDMPAIQPTRAGANVALCGKDLKPVRHDADRCWRRVSRLHDWYGWLVLN